MSINVSRIVLLSSSALASTIGFAEIASAQAPDVRIEQPIVVTTPSPIRRRPAARPAPPAPPRTARPAAPRAPAAPPPPPEPVVTAPQPGTLPIVTDQFATVTVVPNEELRRSTGGTMGDVLFSKPGITGSSFAPGASSRPIIRGLDVNRVGIVENGIGGGGVSDLGEDQRLESLSGDHVGRDAELLEFDAVVETPR